MSPAPRRIAGIGDRTRSQPHQRVVADALVAAAVGEAGHIALRFVRLRQPVVVDFRPGDVVDGLVSFGGDCPGQIQRILIRQVLVQLQGDACVGHLPGIPNQRGLRLRAGRPAPEQVRQDIGLQRCRDSRPHQQHRQSDGDDRGPADGLYQFLSIKVCHNLSLRFSF